MEGHLFLNGGLASLRQIAGYGNLRVKKSPLMPTKDKASCVHLGVPT